jgi:hypothetical protein
VDCIQQNQGTVRNWNFVNTIMNMKVRNKREISLSAEWLSATQEGFCSKDLFNDCSGVGLPPLLDPSHFSSWNTTSFLAVSICLFSTLAAAVHLQHLELAADKGRVHVSPLGTIKLLAFTNHNISGICAENWIAYTGVISLRTPKCIFWQTRTWHWRRFNTN